MLSRCRFQEEIRRLKEQLAGQGATVDSDGEVAQVISAFFSGAFFESIMQRGFSWRLGCSYDCESSGSDVPGLLVEADLCEMTVFPSTFTLDVMRPDPINHA